jgi:3-oxoacyl-[acyl-carrier protein] reductase
MELGISGKLGLVTGCSRGIGRGIAEALAQEGVRLVLVARSSAALDELKNQLHNPEAHYAFPMDLMEPNAPERLADTVNEIGHLDILVNNLGGSGGVSDPFASAEDWAKVWQFNLGIAINLNRAFIPGMVERRWGRIVHLSTLATYNFKGNAAYASAKCALNAYVKSVSRHVAKDNVIISAVAPGAVFIDGRHLAKLQKENSPALQDYFKNNQTINRLAETSEVASVISFMCSEKASFMAGSIVGVDGAGM